MSSDPGLLTDYAARVHLETTGPEDGEPVWLLHGWGSHAANMRPIAEALAATYRVFNVDLPGHGRTPPPPDAWGVPEHAALVAHLIRTHSAPPVTLVGHSNGGRISLFMASTPVHEPLVRRLVLISPSGVTPQRGADYYVRSTTARLLKAPFAFLPRPLREAGLDWLRHTLVWRMLGSSDYQRVQGVMRETFIKTVRHHLDDQVARIQVPTLLFWGTADAAISRRQMLHLEDAIPDAGLVTLEGAGHYGYLDAFHIFHTATTYFLEHT
ncbi:MAG: alpha/beta fold hydrolase [Bacteroidota bacterium]